MKRFRFTLERVRTWREDQSNIEEMRLRQLYDELHNLESMRQEVLDETNRSRRSVLEQHYVTAEELASLEAFCEYAADQVRRIDAKKAALLPRVAEQKKRLLEAHRSFQLVDGLRDKTLLAWTAARDKEQEELAAELYLAGRVREDGLKHRKRRELAKAGG